MTPPVIDGRTTVSAGGGACRAIPSQPGLSQINGTAATRARDPRVSRPGDNASAGPCVRLRGLEIAVGVTLYLMIYAGGVNWPWPLLITMLGVYYVYRGAQIRRLRAQSSGEGEPKVETGKASGENRAEFSRDSHRAT